MIGVGDGGFSGITPCLRRMSFLGTLSAAASVNLLSGRLPFRVSVRVVHRHVDWHVHIWLMFVERNYGALRKFYRHLIGRRSQPLKPPQEIWRAELLTLHLDRQLKSTHPSYGTDKATAIVSSRRHICPWNQDAMSQFPLRSSLLPARKKYCGIAIQLA